MSGNRTMRPISIVQKKGREGVRKSNRGVEFDQSTLYECMDISQQNCFV
jgi:hypothetical protein